MLSVKHLFENMSFCQISFCQMSFCQMSFCQMSFCQISFVKCNLAIRSLKNVILTFSLLIKVCKKKLGSFIFEVLKLNFDKFVLWLMLIYFPVGGGSLPFQVGVNLLAFPSYCSTNIERWLFFPLLSQSEICLFHL